MGVCQYGCANMGVCSPLDQTGCSSLSVQWQVSPVSPVASSSGKQELGRSQWVESLLSALSLSPLSIYSQLSNVTRVTSLVQKTYLIWLSRFFSGNCTFLVQSLFRVDNSAKQKARKMLRKKLFGLLKVFVVVVENKEFNFAKNLMKIRCTSNMSQDGRCSRMLSMESCLWQIVAEAANAEPPRGPPIWPYIHY